MNNIADIFGWIGNIFFIFGAIYLAKKSIFGFWHQIFGNVLYLIQSIFMHIYSLGMLSIILIIINSFAIYNWNKMKRV